MKHTFHNRDIMTKFTLQMLGDSVSVSMFEIFHFNLTLLPPFHAGQYLSLPLLALADSHGKCKFQISWDLVSDLQLFH